MVSDNWMKKMRSLKSVITFDQLCSNLGTETMEEMNDRLMSVGDGCYHAVYTDAIREGCSEEEAEKRGQDSESEELGEYQDKYIRAVKKVSIKLFAEHHLSLKETKKNSLIYRIMPDISWRNSADAIRETINGFGYFRFDLMKDFLSSGPYTSRSAVLSHLHCIFDWSEVYEGTKAKYLVERELS